MRIILNKKIIILIVSIVVVSFFTKMVFAAWNGTFYNPGDTLNPECLPSDPDCDVLPPQVTLVSGTNIKTINSTSLLGSGDIVISGMDIGGAITDAVAGSVLFTNGGGTLAQDTTNFLWDATNHQLQIGPSAGFDGNSQIQLSLSNNVDGYSGVYVQNQNAGESASTDIMVGADNDGVDLTGHFGDFGIQSSGWSPVANPSFNGVSANDIYLYGSGGNLVFGTDGAVAGKIIKFFVGGMTTAHQMMALNTTGLGIGVTDPGAALDVKGTLRLFGSSSGYVGFAPQAAAGAITYTLPNADGNNNYVLTTDGNGNLSWSDKTGGVPGSISSINGDSSAAQTIAAGNGLTIANVGASHTLSTDFTYAPTWTGTHSFTNGTYSALFTGGKVGIGTATPANTLSVSPPQYSTGTASQSAGTVTGVGTTFTSAMVGSQLVFANGTSAGTITAFGSTTSLSVSTSQTVSEQAYAISYTGLQVTSTGNVGIGTTAPGVRLDVVGGDIRTDSNISALGGTLTLGSNGEVGQITLGNTNVRIYRSATANLTLGTFYADNTANVHIYAGASERMTVLGSGNVGIGTTSPSLRQGQKLDIATSNDYGGMNLSTWAAGADTSSILDFSKSRTSTIGAHAIVQSGDALGYINFRGSDGSVFKNAVAIKAEVDGTPGLSDMPGRLVFMTTPDGSATLAERMRIDNQGNVGIGTTNPADKLDVNGTIRQSGAAGIAGYLSTNGGDLSSTTALNPGILVYGTTVGAAKYGMDVGYAGTNYRLRLFTGNTQDIALGMMSTNSPTLQSHFTEFMTIKSTGNVGIGTTAPRYKNTTIGAIGSLLSDDATNYEGLTITPTTGAVTLAGVTAGTGSDNIDIKLTPAGTGNVVVSGNRSIIFDEAFNHIGVGIYSNSNTNYPSLVFMNNLNKTRLTGYQGIELATYGPKIEVVINQGFVDFYGQLYTNNSNYEGLRITPATGSMTLGAVTSGAGADNINIVLTPAGTGYTILNGNVGVGTTTPGGILHTAGGNFVLGPTNASTAASFQLREGSTNGTEFIGFKAPDAVATSVTFTLPSADGTIGQVLQTNGTGTLSWTANSASGMANPLTTTGDIMYASDTAAPSTPARLGIGTAGQCLLVAGGLPSWGACAGTAAAAGADTEIQYNNSGSFGASSNFVWNDTNKTLSLTGTNTGAKVSLALLNDSTGSGASNELRIGNNAGADALTLSVNSDQFTSAAAYAYIYNRQNAPLNLGTNNTARLTILAGGNVGIGTTSPGNKLTVTAPTTADALADVMIGASATTQKGLVIQGKASQTANLQEWQTSAGTVAASMASSGALTFSNQGTTEQYKASATMKVSSGNAGALSMMEASTIGFVGTDSSTIRFLDRNIYSSDWGQWGGAAIFLNDAHVSDPNVSFFTVKRGTGDPRATPRLTVGPATAVGTDLAGPSLTLNGGQGTGTGVGGSIIFQTSPAGSSGSSSNALANAMTILGGGNVGIGTTSPSYRLHVSDTTTAGIVGAFVNSDGTCTLDPGDVGGWSCPSDERLKKDIVVLDSGLAQINQLRPVQYRLINESGDAMLSMGLLAQEVQPIFPKLITAQADGTLSLNYGGFTPAIIKSIQELDLKINEINNFEKENDWRDSLVAWFANAGNRITRIFTGEVCLTSPGEEAVCLNRAELQSLKALVNQSGSSPSGGGGSSSTPEPQGEADQPSEETPEPASEQTTTPPNESGTPPPQGGEETVPAENPPAEPQGEADQPSAETPANSEESTEPEPAPEVVSEPAPEPTPEPTPEPVPEVAPEPAS